MLYIKQESEGNRRRKRDGAESGPEKFSAENYRRTIPANKTLNLIVEWNGIVKGIEAGGLFEKQRRSFG